MFDDMMIVSDALASHSLMIVTYRLTDSLKLEIGNFASLTIPAPPLSYSIRWEYLSGQSGQSGLVRLVIQVNLVTLLSLVTLFSLVNPISLISPVSLVIPVM